MIKSKCPRCNKVMTDFKCNCGHEKTNKDILDEIKKNK